MPKNGVYSNKTGSMKSNGSSSHDVPSGVKHTNYTEVQGGGSFMNNTTESSDKCSNQRAGFIKSHNSDVPY